jgi:hypothetical protein
MKRCRHCLLPLACLAVFAAAGVSSAKTPPGWPLDFGSENDWSMNEISLVRVVSIRGRAEKQRTVILRTERAYTEQWETVLTASGGVTRIVRSYTDQKDTPDLTVPLAAIWFGARRVGPKQFEKNLVQIEAGDELVVWPGRFQPVRGSAHPFLPGIKIVGPADKSPLVKILEQIARIRAAGGRAPAPAWCSKEEIGRVAKLREAGGEAAAKGGASSPDSTVVRYALSVLETMPPKKPDPAFADQLRALRGDAPRPMPVRLQANRLLPLYAAAPEQARAEAPQWLRTIFSTSTADDNANLQPVAREIMASLPKREDRVAYFLAILGDETRPRPVRMASVVIVVDQDCFDFEHPAGKVSSDVFSALLCLLKSKDVAIREAGAGMAEDVCLRIISRKDRVARVNEALSAINAAIGLERDETVRTLMKAYVWHLNNALKE